MIRVFFVFFAWDVACRGGEIRPPLQAKGSIAVEWIEI